MKLMTRSVLSGIIALSVLFAGCSRESESRQGSNPGTVMASAVRTQTVENKKWNSKEEVVGTVRARLHATLEAKLSGRIAEMPTRLGQKVAKGQLLARLDAAEIQARLEQAQASLQQAERDYRRTSSLYDQQAVTRAEYEAADSRLLVAKAAVSEARAIMTYVEILAPFEGVVTKKWAELGDLAVPGKPLFDIEDPSALQLEADVPEALASHIQSAAQMQIRSDPSSQEILGTVNEMSPAADPASRTFRVKLDLPADSPLKSGQFARLLLPTGESVSLRVPSSAVIQKGQIEMVFAVENQHARLHLVKTGRQAKGETEILSGLDPGDQIISDGAAQLVDGQPVIVP